MTITMSRVSASISGIRSIVLPGSVTLLLLATGITQANDALNLRLRSRAEISPGSNRFREVVELAQWNAKETAIVICDMWNDHYCRNAARRVAEMAPTMNEVLKTVRAKGVLIIHSPSGCMDRYNDTSQRKLTQQAPKIETKIPLQNWCYLDENYEDQMPVAVEQPCDDCGTVREAVRFFDRQVETLAIQEGDAISDSADAFYLMKQRGIRNVIIMGVHTNMCVLGRPFGIRQMVYQGQNVALMRDMTDSMYNPRDAPYVNHYTGNDLVFEHIERFWCPTVTSADILDSEPFCFPGDQRKHLVIVMADDEYDAARTLPPFALKNFGAHFKITCVYANTEDRNDIPGIDALNDADVAIWSIRRRTLPKEQLNVLRKYITDGKPLVALRTTSHAFCLHGTKPVDGLMEWPEFDSEVLGGNYHNHYPNTSPTFVRAIEAAAGHPILDGVPTADFRVFGSLYKNNPLATTAAPLMLGHVENYETPEPVAWTHQRPNAGRVFYTSLGHPKSFKIPEFRRLLRNATYWAANLPVPASHVKPFPG